jgi:hypothetical protein
MHNPETSEERMERWRKLLDDKIGKDLDDFYDEISMLISGASIDDSFKTDIIDNNVQNLLILLHYDADVRFSQRQQMREN